MSDQGQRTEKPTKRRLDKARKEGRFAVSREFVAAVQFLVFVALLITWSGHFLKGSQEFARLLLVQAFHTELHRETVVRLYREALFSIFVPLLATGACLTAISLGAQLGTTQLGFALEKLTPDFTRLNPIQKLKDVPKQGFASLTQALLLIPVFGVAIYQVVSGNLATFVSLPLMSLEPALHIVTKSFTSLLWKAGFVLLLLGSVDLLRQHRRYSKTMRMTKYEVRQEHKESDGNPQIKQRIRRIQRDLARRNMMKEVPKATAVIVNPTHFSVAIRYEMETMAAPKVIAKGKNYLAHRIRAIATEHQIPIVENQPLAQALYKSADVGQEIPPDLYRAVAEILAYIFKLMNPGRR
ncbi:MAG: EscU/YscU/HrcU family type III secretion system export apparatus switch protein [Bryobacteraceae bacterium]